MEETECIVIGAGVVGLACAAALARSGREVIVLEAEAQIGMHTSSRNSEVIHAGIYYPPQSLKAKLCVTGKEQLYAYAGERAIAHRRIGKLIVATDDKQVTRLEEIRQNAQASGVGDLAFLSRDEVARLEPRIACVAGLLSPSTGIIDSHALMLSLRGDLEAHGGMVVLNTPVSRGEVRDEAFVIETGGEAPFRIGTRQLVNCAGLYAPALARSLQGVPRSAIPPQRYAIGHYFQFTGKSPCERLVYPVPEPGGLGIHLTLDLAGQARFGPDVEWIDGVDYTFDESRLDRFLAAIRSYLPEIEADRLAPGYTGIRPKISGPGEPAQDFRIDGPQAHSIPGLVNLFGIESPGLTASLAIADHVTDLLG